MYGQVPERGSISTYFPTSGRESLGCHWAVALHLAASKIAVADRQMGRWADGHIAWQLSQLRLASSGLLPDLFVPFLLNHGDQEMQS